jgi:hypothetical protein
MYQILPWYMVIPGKFRAGCVNVGLNFPFLLLPRTKSSPVPVLLAGNTTKKQVKRFIGWDKDALCAFPGIPC